MKVLIITQYFWPEEFRINDLVENLVEHKHQVTVLTGIPNYPKGRYFPGYGLFRNRRQAYKGAQIYRMPILPRGRSGKFRSALSYLSFMLSALVFAPFICRGKIDLIFFGLSPIAEGLPAVVLKSLKRSSLVFWVLDLWPESLVATGAVKSPLVTDWISGSIRYVYRNSDRILVTSKAFIPSIEKMGAGRDKIRYFPNWGESIYEQGRTDNQAVRGADIPDGFKIMFAGNIGAAQDFGTILKAAENLKGFPDIHWLILGEGRMGDWVKEQVRGRALTNVHLLGRYPVETMPAFFSQADAMLVTLKSDKIFSLTVPGKIQSYLACGKPIIACMDGEGNLLIREAGAGLTCKAEDPGGLAEAVLEMYRMPAEKRRSMGAQGKKYYDQNFKREVLFANLESWMEETASIKR